MDRPSLGADHAPRAPTRRARSTRQARRTAKGREEKTGRKKNSDRKKSQTFRGDDPEEKPGRKDTFTPLVFNDFQVANDINPQPQDFFGRGERI
jgi:hypothetical protein